MDDPSGPTFLNIFLGWLPILLLIGVWLYSARLTRRSFPPAAYWDEQQRIDRETLESRRETNRLLADLAAKLER